MTAWRRMGGGLLPLVGLIAIVTGFGAAGAPRPIGRLLDISGRNFHIVCRGSGSPAVILESGTGEFSFDWVLVQSSIAKVTQICAYDRAGYAWSDMSGGFEQFTAIAADMQNLLQKAGIRPPWVLVGHGFGALYARDYQRRFSREVAGLVLVDPTPEEDTQVHMFGNTVSLLDMADHDLRAWPVRPFAPSRTSPPPRRLETAYGTAPFNKLPHDIQVAREWALKRFFEELDSLSPEQALAVMESQRATFTDLYNARHIPSDALKLPVIVLSRGKDTTPQIQQMQDELARLSADTIHRTAANSGTQIQIEQPMLVAEAVAEIVYAIRAGKPLTPGPANHARR
jgi:pimeloyl-ACP methyl ester carboxylesterase